MTDPTQAPAQTPGDGQQVINLPNAAADLLEAARGSHAGRAGRTLIPGAGAALKQTVLALADGHSLADHESPTAATLQVLIGRVRLTVGGTGIELAEGDHAAIPPIRHGLDALEDAAVLISVAQGPSGRGEGSSGRGEGFPGAAAAD